MVVGHYKCQSPSDLTKLKEEDFYDDDSNNNKEDYKGTPQWGVPTVLSTHKVAPDGEYHAGKGIGPEQPAPVTGDSWHPGLKYWLEATAEVSNDGTMAQSLVDHLTQASSLLSNVLIWGIVCHLGSLTVLVSKLGMQSVHPIRPQKNSPPVVNDNQPQQSHHQLATFHDVLIMMRIWSMLQLYQPKRASTANHRRIASPTRP
jgi:hypothetical protein